MLGFSAYSETPISQAVTSAKALAYLQTLQATSYVNNADIEYTANVGVSSFLASSQLSSISVDAEALVFVSSVSALSDLDNPSYSAKASATPGSLLASITYNAYQSLIGAATTEITALNSSATVDDISYIARAVITPTNAVAEIRLEPISYGLSADAPVGSVTGSVNIYNLFTTADATTNRFSGVYATFEVPTVEDVSAYASINIPWVKTNVLQRNVESKGGGKREIVGVEAGVNASTADPTAVRYVWPATSFSRKRMIVLEAQERNYTVYIERETNNYTIYITN